MKIIEKSQKNGERYAKVPVIARAGGAKYDFTHEITTWLSRLGYYVKDGKVVL